VDELNGEGVGSFHIVQSDDASANPQLTGEATVEDWVTESGSGPGGGGGTTVQPGHAQGTYQITGSVKGEGAQAYLELNFVGTFPGTTPAVIWTLDDGRQLPLQVPESVSVFWFEEEKTPIRFIRQPIRFSLDGETKPYSRTVDTSYIPPAPGVIWTESEDGEITVEPDQGGTAPIPTS